MSPSRPRHLPFPEPGSRPGPWRPPSPAEALESPGAPRSTPQGAAASIGASSVSGLGDGDVVPRPPLCLSDLISPLSGVGSQGVSQTSSLPAERPLPGTPGPAAHQEHPCPERPAPPPERPAPPPPHVAPALPPPAPPGGLVRMPPTSGPWHVLFLHLP